MGKTLDLGPLPWDVETWLNSPTRHKMTTSARSVYHDLLAVQWKDGAIPRDLGTLASLAAVTPEEFAATWPAVRSQFVKGKQGGLVNRKLEALRLLRIRTLEDHQQSSAAGGRERARRINELSNTPTSAPQLEHTDSLSVGVVFNNSQDHKPPNKARSVSGSVPVSRGNGYDPKGGWEKFRAAFPHIRKPDQACRMFVAVCESAATEAAILAGLAHYLESGEVGRGVLTSAENWLRDRMWEGKFAAGSKREETERERLRGI